VVVVYLKCSLVCSGFVSRVCMVCVSRVIFVSAVPVIIFIE